jgi:hypothetical protein
VEDLVALNPYNPDILNDLEKFVNEQVNPSHTGMLLPPLVSPPSLGLASAFGSAN